MLYYATEAKDELVPESDPRARYVVNPVDPGEFAGLLRQQDEARQEAAAQEAAEVAEMNAKMLIMEAEAAALKAAQPVEDKAQAPAEDKEPFPPAPPPGGPAAPAGGRPTRRHP